MLGHLAPMRLGLFRPFLRPRFRFSLLVGQRLLTRFLSLPPLFRHGLFPGRQILRPTLLLGGDPGRPGRRLLASDLTLDGTGFDFLLPAFPGCRDLRFARLVDAGIDQEFLLAGEIFALELGVGGRQAGLGLRPHGLGPGQALFPIGLVGQRRAAEQRQDQPGNQSWGSIFHFS